MNVDAGPRLFFSCPIDCNQFPTWFTDLWNYSIVPYVLEAVREGVQVNWRDNLVYMYEPNKILHALYITITLVPNDCATPKHDPIQ